VNDPIEDGVGEGWFNNPLNRVRLATVKKCQERTLPNYYGGVKMPQDLTCKALYISVIILPKTNEDQYAD